LDREAQRYLRFTVQSDGCGRSFPPESRSSALGALLRNAPELTSYREISHQFRADALEWEGIGGFRPAEHETIQVKYTDQNTGDEPALVWVKYCF
jgi:hypothetical protein